MDINFNVAFAEDGQKSEINENTWKLGWVEIVGGINGVPTAQQFNQFGYIFDKKANIAYAKATEASKGLDDKADKTSVEAALAEKANSADVVEALKGKSDTGHTHDNRYYTESETDTLLNGKAATNHAHSNVTTSAAGFMSSSDKSKLDGISESADSVSVSPSLTSGTKVGTITINGTAYDLYCQTNTDTKYSAGTGISISGTTIINSGVRSIASGGSNGTISVNTNGSAANVAVKGLASAAYQAVQTAAGTVGLHRISSGTADATTTNCPAGCWYGKHD